MSEALEVVGYQACQFSWGGLLDGLPAEHAIHLVRRTKNGTPGPTLCGIDRFAKDGPGWSMGGGFIDPEATACEGCDRERDPSLPVVHISFCHLFASQRLVPQEEQR